MRSRRSFLLAPFFTTLMPLALAACDSNGPEMRPGENCMTCHSSGGSARTWTVAGTVFSKPDDSTSAGVPGVDVVITGSDSQTLTLTTNAAGNFYTSRSVAFPISAELHRGTKVVKMALTVGTGACSSCHDQPPTSGAPGRDYIGQ